MINYAKVYEKYPNHKIISIDSIWYTGSGWVNWMVIYMEAVKGATREQILDKAFAEGAEKVCLTLATFSKFKLLWVDFTREEIFVQKP